MIIGTEMGLVFILFMLLVIGTIWIFIKDGNDDDDNNSAFGW